MIITIITALTLSLVISGALVFAWRRGALAAFADRPNDRSMHETPRLRLGGVGVVVAVVTALLLTVTLDAGHGPQALALLMSALFVVSLIDDRRSLPIAPRLLAQFVCAAAFLWSLGQVPLAGAAASMLAVVLIIAMVWMVNLYNFMDGIDGIAGAMTVIGFGALAAAAAAGGDPELALSCAAIAAAGAGFLIWNLPPSRIFLGDSGAVPLGFAAGACALWGVLDGSFHASVPLIVFAPFVSDATLTLLRRLLAGERFWAAHRSHLYQRLALGRLGPVRTLALEATLMLACAAVALWVARSQPAPGVGAVIVGSVYATVAGVLVITTKSELGASDAS